MSYALYDANGYVADLATTRGLGELIAIAGTGKTPALADLLETGKADDVAPIIDEIKAADQFAELRDALRRATPPVFISDGVIENGE